MWPLGMDRGYRALRGDFEKPYSDHDTNDWARITRGLAPSKLLPGLRMRHEAMSRRTKLC